VKFDPGFLCRKVSALGFRNAVLPRHAGSYIMPIVSKHVALNYLPSKHAVMCQHWAGIGLMQRPNTVPVLAHSSMFTGYSLTLYL